MFSSLIVVATGEISWTPEIFYGVVAVLHLIVVLVAFRVMDMRAEHNTFISGLLIVGAANGIAFLTKGLGMIGILITGSLFFLFLVAGTRGDVFKSAVAWVLVIAVYWGAAHYVVNVEYALQSEDLGSIPYLLLEGEMEGEGVTQADYRRLKGGG